MRRAGLICLAGLAIVGGIGSSCCCVGEPLASTWLLPLILRESAQCVINEGLGSFGGGAELVTLERLSWRRSVDNISVAATASDAADRVSANWLWRLLSAWVNHSGAKVEKTTVTEKAMCSMEARRCSVSGAGSSATTWTWTSYLA